MNLIFLMFLGFMLLLSFRLSGVYSPSSLMLAVWFLDFVAQYWFGFYVIELKTEMLLAIFVTYFVMGAFLGYTIRFKKSNYEWSEKRIYNAIKMVFMLLLIVAPFLFVDLRDNVGFDLDNFTVSVRRYYVALGTEGRLPITIRIMANFSIVLVVLSCIRSNIHLYKRILFIACGVLGTTISFGKGYLVLMLGYVCSVIIFQKRKTHLYLMAIILSGFLVLIMSAVVRDRADVGRYFRIYLLSSVPAFQMIVDDKFHFPFPTLFGFMKPVYESFGIKIGTISGDNYVEVPDYTNVFTAFGPALSDYGFLFTVFYFMINGCFSGIVFNLARSNYMIFKILYGFVVFAIVSSVFSDAFALWSTIFYYLVILIIINYYARKPSDNRNLAAVY